MWSFNSSESNEAEEIPNLPPTDSSGRSFTRTSSNETAHEWAGLTGRVPPSHRRSARTTLRLEAQADPEEFVLLPEGPSTSRPAIATVDLHFLKSFESYAAVQRTTTARPLRCECSEVLAVSDHEEHFSIPPSMTRGLLPSHSSFGHSSSSSGTEYDGQIRSANFSYSADVEAGTSKSPAVLSHVAYEITCPNETTPWAPGPPRLHSLQNLYTRSMPQPSLIAKRIANKVIGFARSARNEYEEYMCCLNCGCFPTYPVTGNCGHTRCAKCVQIMARCPCGNETQQPLIVNILIRDLLQKAVKARIMRVERESFINPERRIPQNELLVGTQASGAGPIRRRRRQVTESKGGTVHLGPYEHQIPMCARAHFTRALSLLRKRRHRRAAPYLAIAAASSYGDLRVARKLLAQAITMISVERNPRTLTPELNRHVRRLTSMSWIKTDDLECLLCCEILTEPVTTPCGHMFCRVCVEKTLFYSAICPLCRTPLSDLNLAETNDTLFVKGALASINALEGPTHIDDKDLVPIFVCTVAFPFISCPLFIFDPRYWLMVRRILESGSRRFGMVAMDRDKKYADFGTILEVCDCIQLEDGRSILSTIGISRFKVIERSVRYGCDVARIQPIHDIPPTDAGTLTSLQTYASKLSLKAIDWLSQLNAALLLDIENAFGKLPTTREDADRVEWLESSDGPAWLWWIVAVLPLRSEIKGLILATDCLLKRMKAVERTLDTVSRVTLAADVKPVD